LVNMTEMQTQGNVASAAGNTVSLHSKVWLLTRQCLSPDVSQCFCIVMYTWRPMGILLIATHFQLPACTFFYGRYSFCTVFALWELPVIFRMDSTSEVEPFDSLQHITCTFPFLIAGRIDTVGSSRNTSSDYRMPQWVIVATWKCDCHISHPVSAASHRGFIFQSRTKA
jgi:hypothetical protein